MSEGPMTWATIIMFSSHNIVRGSHKKRLIACVASILIMVRRTSAHGKRRPSPEVSNRRKPSTEASNKRKPSTEASNNRPSTEASNKSYQIFLGMIAGVSLFSLCQQITHVSGTDTITVQLPWELEFQIRHTLGKKAAENPFSEGELIKNPTSEIKTALALSQFEDEKSTDPESKHGTPPIEKHATKSLDQAAAAKERQDKASVNYKELLKRKAQQLAPSQGGFSKNKDHTRAQATAAKFAGLFAKAKPGLTKLAASPTDIAKPQLLRANSPAIKSALTLSQSKVATSTEPNIKHAIPPIEKHATKPQDQAAAAEERQDKASVNHKELLKLKAQQLVPSQGGFSKNKDQTRARATAAKLAGLFASAKPGLAKLAADKTPGVQRFVADPGVQQFVADTAARPQLRKKKKLTKSSNHTGFSEVPRLFGAELDDAIQSEVKPRREKLPPLLLKVCDACENSFLADRFSCKRRILPWIDKDTSEASLKEGQAFVANEKEQCKACDPESCEGKIHYPFRFDEGRPLILNAKTHDLASIPKNYRIPSEFLYMTSSYFKFWTKERPPVFFTYNPSIIAVPPGTDINVPGATYIASYRVSPWHNCGFKTYNFRAKLWHLMGLAILDENLDIIEGTDVVVNINEQTQMREEAQKFEDFRLFYFNDKIWLLDGSLIVPIQIASNHRGKLNTMKDRLPVLFGTGLTVGFLEPVQHLLEIPPGKNYNIFTTPDGGTFLETTPRHPRVVYQLDFDGMYGAKESGASHNHDMPDDSYVTDETFLRRPYLLGREKGTACCTKLEKRFYQDFVTDPEILKHDYLLMGIGHRRTFRKVKNEDNTEGKEKFDYLSRLYAFVPEAPFDLVANSGMFCFGFPEDEEAEHVAYANATKHFNKMEIYNKVYPCPTVQLATGMTEKVGDDDRIIVSYGVNDCVPRMVELHKQDLAHRMFLSLTEKEYVPQFRS